MGTDGQIYLLARSNPIKIPKSGQTHSGHEHWLRVKNNLNDIVEVNAEPNHKGYLSLILHAHLPFVRHPGNEIYLEEEWLFEAITECYIPLLRVLNQLVEEAIDFRLTISLSPPLISMLEDSHLQSKYINYLDRLIILTKKEIKRTQHESAFNNLAKMYYQNFIETKELFCNVYQKYLIGAFKKLQDIGVIEIITCAGTHGFLPILQVNPSTVRAQIEVAVNFFKRIFGRGPKGIWLPECGYYEGLDQLLKEYGIQYFILDSHGILNGSDKPKYCVFSPVHCPTGVAGFARDPESSNQVWSAESGYPGDADYREFYRDIGFDLDSDYIKDFALPNGERKNTGIKYYRITGEDVKQPYNRERALNKAAIHAQMFMENKVKQVNDLTRSLFRDSNRFPIIVAPFDAELFGHWWYEGPAWINYLIRKIVFDQRTIKLSTPSEYLEEHPVNQVMVPSASTWGHNGYNEVWLDDSNDWIYPHLVTGAKRIQILIDKFGKQRSSIVKRALKQAIRELMLAQSSDWAFIMRVGTTVEYASLRIKRHIERFNKIYDQLQNSDINEAWLSEIENEDNIFPQLNINIFKGDNTVTPSKKKLESIYIPWFNFHQPDIWSDVSGKSKLINYLEDLLLSPVDSQKKKDGICLLHTYYSALNHLEELAEKGFEPRVMITLSGSFMEFLKRLSNPDIIKDIPEKYSNILRKFQHLMLEYSDVVEIVGSGCYQPVFSHIPEEDFLHQISEWKDIFSQSFGEEHLKKVKGFWAPNIDLGERDGRLFKLISILKQEGYEWLLLNRPLSKEYSPTSPHFLTVNYKNENVSITTVFGNPIITDIIEEKRTPLDILHKINQIESGKIPSLILSPVNKGQNALHIQSFFSQIYGPFLKMVHGVPQIQAMNMSEFLKKYYSKNPTSEIILNCQHGSDLELLKNEIKKLSLFFNASIKRYREKGGWELNSGKGKNHPAFTVYKEAKHILLSCESTCYEHINDEFWQQQIKNSLHVAKGKIIEMHRILNPQKDNSN